MSHPERRARLVPSHVALAQLQGRYERLSRRTALLEALCDRLAAQAGIPWPVIDGDDMPPVTAFVPTGPPPLAPRMAGHP